MHINSGNIGMESSRNYSSVEFKSRSYSAMIYDQNSDLTGFENLLMNNSEEGESLSEDAEEKEVLKGNNVSDIFAGLGNRIGDVKVSEAGETQLSIREQISRIKEQCLYLLLRLLFPDRKFPDSKEFSLKSSGDNALENSESAGGRVVRLNYSSAYYFEESESTNFSAEGKVCTSDGREIDFGININMSRSFAEYYSEEIDYLEVSLTDPLIINFDTDITGLSDQTFCFDLDSDGVEERINKLVCGSGFLALDLNEDGIINDGSELFGTKSGNGFKDLEQYDSDRDGFIDEDDEVFDKLKIWCPNENGGYDLYSLKEKGIGAIGLSNAQTDFSLNDFKDNSTNGIIRRTGVFLYENGNVGTIQQLDMARHESDVKKALQAYA